MKSKDRATPALAVIVASAENYAAPREWLQDSETSGIARMCRPYRSSSADNTRPHAPSFRHPPALYPLNTIHVPDSSHRFLLLFQLSIGSRCRLGGISKEDEMQASHASPCRPVPVLRLPHRHPVCPSRLGLRAVP